MLVKTAVSPGRFISFFFYFTLTLCGRQKRTCIKMEQKQRGDQVVGIRAATQPFSFDVMKRSGRGQDGRRGRR